MGIATSQGIIRDFAGKWKMFMKIGSYLDENFENFEEFS
jgi:hypothetical protein